MRPVSFDVVGSIEHADHTNWPIEEVLTRLGWDGRSKGSGKWVGILCPFHEDRKIGNAGFSRALNAFRCHACGTAGNSVTLVMHVKGIDARTAVEWLNSQEISSSSGEADAPGQQSSRLIGGMSVEYKAMRRGLR